MAREAEIGKHDVHSFFRKVKVRNENVFGLYIPVNDLLGVMQILQRAKQLLQNEREDSL